MPAIRALIIFLHLAASASAITIDIVPIGDVGNPNDPTTGNLLLVFRVAAQPEVTPMPRLVLRTIQSRM